MGMNRHKSRALPTLVPSNPSGLVRVRLDCSELEARITPVLSFRDPDSYGSLLPQMRAVAVGDINNDGQNDFVVSNKTSSVQVFLNGGDPNSAAFNSGSAPINLGVSQARSLALKHINNDKFIDLIAVNDTSKIVTVLLGNGSSFSDTPINTAALPANAKGLIVADFDEDGRFDVATTTGSKFAIFFNDNSAKLFADPIFYDIPGANFVDLAAGEFNGDGKLDIAVADLSSNGIYLFGQDAKTGKFLTSGTPLSIGSAPSVIVTGRFAGGDGLDEVVYGSADKGEIGVFRNTGGGFSPSAAKTGVPGAVVSMKAADFNADGNRDLVVVYDSPIGGSVSILEGNGQATFAVTSTLALLVTDNPAAVAVADYDDTQAGNLVGDFNRDNKSDFVVVNKNSLARSEIGVVINDSVLTVTQFDIRPPANTPIVGNTFNVGVRALTAAAVQVFDYAGTITFSSSDPGASLPANYTFNLANQGQQTFPVTFVRSGTQTLTVTQIDKPAVTSTKEIDIGAGPAASFLIEGPLTVTADTDSFFRVSVLDAFGNIATSYDGRVSFTTTDSRATFFTSRPGVPERPIISDIQLLNGVRDFKVIFETTGSQSITIADNVNKSLVGFLGNIIVGPPPDRGTPPGSIPEEPGFPLPSLPTIVAGGGNPDDLPLTAITGPGRVRIFDSNGTRLATVSVGNASGTPRSALADINGDNIVDVITGSAPGGTGQVEIYDGATGGLIRVIQAFEDSFTGGVFVAVGDLDGDGMADLVITADQGGSGRVRIINLATGAVIADFLGIDDPEFRGGARATIGDLNGDGRNDLIVAAGFGGGPRVAGFDGLFLNTVSPLKLFGDFFVFEQTLRNGVFVSAGDIDGDGADDLVFGGGPGGGPRVFALSGRPLVESGFQVQLANFFAGDSNNRTGVRIAVKDLDGDSKRDIVTGEGGGGTRVSYYYGNQITPTIAASAGKIFDAFEDGITSGVFVG